MNFDEMTKKELIDYIRKLEKNRAFSYKDQMILRMLDEAPFSLWACDKDYKIILWSGKSESLYGYNEKYALGKDFTNLFVSPDEKYAARKDCNDIICNGSICHNISNDKGKYGFLELLSNCFRIKDVKTNEYCHAEIALSINYLEDERLRVKNIIEEGKKIKSTLEEFHTITTIKLDLLKNRKKILLEQILKAEERAIERRTREEYISSVKPIIEKIQSIENIMVTKTNDLHNSIMRCNSLNECNNIKSEFSNIFDELMNKLNALVLDFRELNQLNEGDTTLSIMQESLLKNSTGWVLSVREKVNKLLDDVEKSISNLKRVTNKEALDGEYYNSLVENKSSYIKILDEISDIFSNMLKEISSSKNEKELMLIQEKFNNSCNIISKKIFNANICSGKESSK